MGRKGFPLFAGEWSVGKKAGNPLWLCEYSGSLGHADDGGKVIFTNLAGSHWQLESDLKAIKTFADVNEGV